MSSDTRNTHYQDGSIERVQRVKGPEVWVFRWWDTSAGKRRQSKVIGSVERYPNLQSARRAVENLRAEINSDHDHVSKITIEGAWGHLQANEFYSPEANRSPTTIDVYKLNFKNHIIPRWGSTGLDDVKAVGVEMAAQSAYGPCYEEQTSQSDEFLVLACHPLRAV